MLCYNKSPYYNMQIINMHQAFVTISMNEITDNVIALQNAYHIVSILCEVN